MQSAEATHIHDDDQSRLECEICSVFTGVDEDNVLITNFCLQVNPAKDTSYWQMKFQITIFRYLLNLAATKFLVH